MPGSVVVDDPVDVMVLVVGVADAADVVDGSVG